MAYIKANPGWRSSTSDSKGNGIKNLTLGEMTHDGLILGSGTSAAPKTSSTASKKFMSFYFQNSATSGESYGFYLKLTGSGIAGSITTGRIYAYTNVAADTVQGAQISVGFGAAGKVSGLAVGCRSQVTFADDATAAPTGTIAGGQSELYFNGDNSSTTDPSAATVCSIHRFIVDGDTTARAKVPYLFEIVNVSSGTSDATKILNTAHLTASHCLRCKINGADYGILLDAY